VPYGPPPISRDGPEGQSGTASRLIWGRCMTRVSMMSHPLLLGFEDLGELLNQISKIQNDGYPPYNLERLEDNGTGRDLLRITIAVAGFTADQLDVCVEDNRLIIRGKQTDDKSRVFLYRGIAARQFQRVFVLAEGLEVVSAGLDNGLLTIDIMRRQPERVMRKITIAPKAGNGAG
jgi:HSP20 family molecular chaperone IbpA